MPKFVKTCADAIHGITGRKTRCRQSPPDELNRVRTEGRLEFGNDRECDRFGCSAAKVQANGCTQSCIETIGFHPKICQQSRASCRRTEQADVGDSRACQRFEIFRIRTQVMTHHDRRGIVLKRDFDRPSFQLYMSDEFGAIEAIRSRIGWAMIN